MNPQILHELSYSLAGARVLLTSTQLGVFSHISAGAKTASEIASAAEASERGIRMLLDALVAFGLLIKEVDGYALTRESAQFLVRESPDYIGAIFENDRSWQTWGKLTDVVKTGRPVHLIEKQDGAAQFFPALVRSLHVRNREPARKTAEVLGVGTTHHGLTVLDVACGSGIWGIAIAQADKQAHVTAQDFADMLDLTRHYVKAQGLEERFDYLPGDLKQVDFGEDRFDVALLGNIVHSEGEQSSKTLFKKLHRALKSGGRIAIVDMVPDEDRTGPVYPVIFALNMLLNTEEGGTYTLAEYRDWLAEAGFKGVETADIGSHSPLIIAAKP